MNVGKTQQGCVGAAFPTKTVLVGSQSKEQIVI